MRLSRLLPVLATLFVLASHAGSAQPARAFLWMEGEDADRHTFNGHGWYSGDGVRKELLSPGSPGAGGADGEWLAHYSNRSQTAEASYDFDVTTAGDYTLWFRGSVYQVRQWYRLDAGPQVLIDLESDPRERMNVLEPGRIDIRFTAWIRVGSVSLAAGQHTITMGLEHHDGRQPDEVHGAIDALCLANYAWAPSGSMRPSLDPPSQPGPRDWFPFVPGDDPLSPDSVTDMRHLLHRPAGTHGHLQRQGSDFAFADGTPVKFWGVNAGVPATPALMAQQARFLAKHGVNLVRLHPVQSTAGLLVRDPATGARELDPARLDRLDRWFAALKSEGIYSEWSPVYPHVVTPDDGYEPDLYAELPDRGAGKSTSGFVNYVRALQDAEWSWLRPLLDHVNPYTGVRYADDPALAIVEIHNEDSIFWHYPLNDLAAGDATPLHTALLQRMWAEWLRGAYASDVDLLAAWGPSGSGSRPGDALTNESMPVYGAWEMEADGPRMNKAEKRRVGDFIRFLAETQRAYFERRIGEMRGVGFQGVTVTTAWKAGGPAANAANLWTDDAGDAIDRHAYFGGGAGGHGVAPGEVNNDSHMRQPGQGILGVGFQQVADKPFIISEWNQNVPNEWRAEIAPLVAFVGLGLQGWDASLHFTAGDAVRYGGGWPNLRSYVSETPVYMAQFPALAMAVHRGDVAQGAEAASRRIELDDAFRGVDAFTQALPGNGYDPTDPSSTLLTPSEAIAMGRVVAKIEAGAGASEKSDWDQQWDQAQGTVKGDPGRPGARYQTMWHYARRYATLQTDRTTAVIGHVAGDENVGGYPFLLEPHTPFVSVIFTSLDDRPLDSAHRILVTALARDRQTGASYDADGTELLELGGPPLLLEPVRATIRYRSSAGTKIVSVRPLDMYGVPKDVEVPHDDTSFTIDGRFATYYYEIRTDGGAPTPTPPTQVPSATPPTPGSTASTPGATPTDRPTGAAPTHTPQHEPVLLPFANRG